jgi:hypothetical protein
VGVKKSKNRLNKKKLKKLNREKKPIRIFKKIDQFGFISLKSKNQTEPN